MKIIADKRYLFWISFCLVVVVSVSVFLINHEEPEYKPGSSATYDTAIRMSKALYRRDKAAGVDFSNGPCLSNDLMPDWVVDIVHNPRWESDNYLTNQCQALLEGRAHHLVELDTEGNFVRIQ